MFNCHLCQQEYAKEVGLKMHLRKTHNEYTLECDRCNKIFDTVGKLRMHKKFTHERRSPTFMQLMKMRICLNLNRKKIVILF